MKQQVRDRADVQPIELLQHGGAHAAQSRQRICGVAAGLGRNHPGWARGADRLVT